MACHKTLNTVNWIKYNCGDKQELLSVALQKETTNDSLATLLSKQNEQLVEPLVDRSSIESFQSHIFSAMREQCLGG